MLQIKPSRSFVKKYLQASHDSLNHAKPSIVDRGIELLVMSQLKRTRKGRPARNAQRSALIVTRGKTTGRDAQIKPKQAQRVIADEAALARRLESNIDAPDSVEAFLERATSMTVAWESNQAESALILSDSPHDDSDDSTLFESLPIPQRPAWDKNTTAAELREREEKSFLIWRRAIAEREERERSRLEAQLNDGDFLAPSSTASTPFERNLEVWRQLWRTLERSDCVFVIVDARWPDFYAPNHLLTYVSHLGKKAVVVINKADFLKQPQRAAWAAHWASRGIACAFFSARREQACIDGAAKGCVFNVNEDDEDRTTRLLRPEELLELGASLAAERYAADQSRPKCIGMVGYPNVGKSSCVNALRGATGHGVGARAAVSATPGKTKHLQTLRVGEELELCDCPGLVFPALVTNGAAELVCSGVVPLARARDPVAAARLVAMRIPSAVFDLHYGTVLTRSDVFASNDDLLDAYCNHRNYKAAGSGVNDRRRAATDIVRDYVDGVLLHCHPPPDCVDIEAFVAHTRATALDPSSALRAKLDKALLTAKRPGGRHTRSADILVAASRAGFELDDGIPSDAATRSIPPPPLPHGSAASVSHTITKRSNKWGKKGRRFRDPEPYGARDAVNVL